MKKKRGLVLVVCVLAALCAPLYVQAADWYVSKDTGKNANDGSKIAPFKNIHKALEKASPGDKIFVAEGNYFGLMDVGYTDIKKAVELYGGYSKDFGARDVLKFRSLVMPPSKANGTSNSKALFMVEIDNNASNKLVIDGFIFDKGDSNGYHAKDGKPEGVSSGMLLLPPTAGLGGVITSYNPIIKGRIGAADTVIQNCVFNNGSCFAIQLAHGRGTIKVLNNVFTANTMSACEISGTVNAVNVTTLEFAHNTVLFTWSRTKAMEDMGYGVRCMTGVDINIHHNLIGLSSFSGIDRTRIDPDKAKEAARKTSIDNNIFFLNKQADMTLPSGGGMFMRIFVDMFEDVGGLQSASGNKELEDAQGLKAALNKAYLEGFLSATYKEKAEYDANSPMNTALRALGVNQVGKLTTSVSMFANRYPLEDAVKLFGAVQAAGAQAIQ